MPKRAAEPSPDTRTRLLAGALRLLAEHGPEALQVRRIAAEAGTSTMTVYTHFGSMDELRNALIREGLARFGEQLATVGRGEDPIADLFLQGRVYRAFALENAQLYRMMFGVSTPKSNQHSFRDLSTEDTPTELTEGQSAFGLLADVAERARDRGRIKTEDPIAFAAQVWSAIHGYVLLEMAGFYGAEGEGVRGVLVPLFMSLLVGAGDSRQEAQDSFDAAGARIAE